MATRPVITHLIQLTLAALVGVVGGCGTDEEAMTTVDSGECGGGETRDAFEFTDWELTSEGLTTINASVDSFEELDNTQQCRAVCAYAFGDLNAYLDPENYPDREFEFTSCTLDLMSEEGMITGGTLSCAGDQITTSFCLGRRPLMWVDDAASSRKLLSEMAVLEHVSITAFVELAAQLEQLGAPVEFVVRCREAARDESRHVKLLVELGATEPTQQPKPAQPETSILAIARHNATEGCVSETWAALLAQYQSERAEDPAARRVFTQIAGDEGRHAQLAWDLHAWLRTQLSPAEVAEVEAAHTRALSTLGTTALRSAMLVSTHDRQALGLPDPRTAKVLANRFAVHLAAA